MPLATSVDYPLCLKIPLLLCVKRFQFYRDEAHFTGEGCRCGTRIAYIDPLSIVGVIFGVRVRVVDVATCGLHGNEGHDLAGPGAFGVRRCAYYDVLRERRAVDGEVALEICVPRNAENAGVVEDGDGVANLRGPIAVTGVEAPSAAILRAGWIDFAQLASSVVDATIGIKRSVADEGGGTETGFILREKQVRMAGYDRRIQRGPLWQLLHVLPRSDGRADALEVVGARLRADHHVEDQGAVVGRVDDDRRRPERPARAARLRLAVVDVVSLVESLFRGSQRQNHGRCSGRIQLFLKPSDSGLRIEVRCIRPGIAEQRLVIGVRL